VPDQQVIGKLVLVPLSNTLTSTATDLYSFNSELDQQLNIGSQSGGATGAGRLTSQGATFTVPIGSALTQLMMYEAQGQHYKSATAELYKPGTTTVVGTYEMYLVAVKSLILGNDGAATASTQATVTVEFGGYTATVPPSSAGQPPSTAQWNLINNNSDVSNI
jgi:type VI protein secretion system component Hcp